jgi:hypothetical protein
MSNNKRNQTFLYKFGLFFTQSIFYRLLKKTGAAVPRRGFPGRESSAAERSSATYTITNKKIWPRPVHSPQIIIPENYKQQQQQHYKEEYIRITYLYVFTTYWAMDA